MTGFALDTASGVRLDLDNPRPEQILLADVAGALSRICRFGAQTRAFYSAAQHAVLVAELVETAGHPEFALAALHHDSHEAFACDLPSPLKRRINAASDGYYERLCDSLDRAINVAFGIGPAGSDPMVARISRTPTAEPCSSKLEACFTTLVRDSERITSCHGRLSTPFRTCRYRWTPSTQSDSSSRHTCVPQNVRPSPADRRSPAAGGGSSPHAARATACRAESGRPVQSARPARRAR